MMIIQCKLKQIYRRSMNHRSTEHDKSACPLVVFQQLLLINLHEFVHILAMSHQQEGRVEIEKTWRNHSHEKDYPSDRHYGPDVYSGPVQQQKGGHLANNDIKPDS